MIETHVSLYLASRERLASLQKTLSFEALPRMHEFVKVRNREQGDYFAFSVMQITHCEGGLPQLWLHLTTVFDGRVKVSFLDDGELDEYVEGYKQEGWVLA